MLSVSVCVCVHVPFHALFSPSLCEAAPSVSKFICHTSSGLVWSRGRQHTLFMSDCRNTAGGLCVYEFVCVCDYLHAACMQVFALSWFHSFVRLHFSLRVCAPHTCEKVHVHTYPCVCEIAFAAMNMCVSVCLFTQRQRVSDMFMPTWNVYACMCLHSSWHVWICVYLWAPMDTYEYRCVCVCVWAPGVPV